MATNPTIGSSFNAAAVRPDAVADHQRTESPFVDSAPVVETPSEDFDPANEAILAAGNYDDASELSAGNGISSVVAHLSPDGGSGV